MLSSFAGTPWPFIVGPCIYIYIYIYIMVYLYSSPATTKWIIFIYNANQDIYIYEMYLCSISFIFGGHPNRTYMLWEKAYKPISIDNFARIKLEQNTIHFKIFHFMFHIKYYRFKSVQTTTSFKILINMIVCIILNS